MILLILKKPGALATGVLVASFRASVDTMTPSLEQN